eukprot:4478965-Amphidinium_carterae.1
MPHKIVFRTTRHSEACRDALAAALQPALHAPVPPELDGLEHAIKKCALRILDVICKTQC